MNILALTNRLSKGSTGPFVVRLANELARRRHHVVVASAGGAMVSHLDDRVLHLEAPTRSTGPLGVWRLSSHLSEIIRTYEIQVVHANSPGTALAASLACWSKAIPVVTSAHGSWYQEVKPHVARMLSFGSDCVIGCSDTMTTDLVRQGLHPRKALTIHDGVSACAGEPDPALRAEVRRELDLPEEAPVILFVGPFARNKGLDDLLNAMARVLWRKREAHMVLVGDGEMLPACRAQAHSLGIESALRFLGVRDDVSRLMAAADVFTLPSLGEGFPLAVAEAMAAGLPVVSTQVGGVPEIVLANITGLLVAPKSPTRLADGLLKLLEDPVLARRMGLAGKLHVEAHFTLDQMVSKFESLYRAQLNACITGMLQRALLS